VKAKPEPKPVEAKSKPKPEPKVAARQGATSVDGAAEAREGARPEAVEVSAAPEELNASSTEGFAQLREGLTEITATDLKQVAKNKRGKISKAYVAMAQAPARATLKCAACSSFH
jgi:hypothetical protein